MTDFEFSELQPQRAYGSTASLRDQTIACIFDDNARRWPDRAALVLGDVSLTYAEVSRRATAVASHLRTLGVGRGSFVAFCMPRSIESAICTLAIVKAGAAYVPLDPEYPEPRLRFMLEDSGAKHVLVAGASKLDLSGSNVQAIDVHRVLGAVRDERPAALHDVNAPDDIACVLYTSGSTGQPKGVLIRNTSIVGHVCEVNWIEFHETDRVAQLNNLSFDPTTTELWGAWLNGAALVILPVEILTDSRALAHEIRAQRLTMMFIPAGLLRIHAANAPEMFGSLEVLASGGEAADPEVFARILRSASPPRKLLNVYGPTEATTQVTFYVVPTPAAANGNGLSARVPVGAPVTGANCLILDETRHPVAAGETGELCVGGRPLSAGYLNRPELNAEKFIPDPTSPGERLYRTGDLARWTDDGHIDLLGRNDEQIKRRDFRIEPGEVQAALNALPGITQSYVMQRKDGSTSPALVAYLVLSDNQSAPTPSELRRSLRTSLPAPSIPDKFVVLPRLPLTPNGKVDRAALPAPESAEARPVAAAPMARQSEESSRVLATDRPRSTSIELAWRRVTAQLEPAVVEAVRSAARAFDDSTQNVLFAAWQVLLTRWTGEQRFDVALLSRIGGTSTALLLTETIVPCDLSADSLRFSQLLAQTRDIVAAETRASAPPLASERRTQIGFAFVEVDASGEIATPSDAGLEVALEIVQGTQVVVSAHYRDDLFERATAQSLLDLYVRLISRLANLQSISIPEIELISPEEQAKLIHGFNDTAQPYPSELQVHELFEQCARTSPYGVAVVYDGQSVTYEALNRRANQLARHLRERGVRSDVTCGIALPRSTDMVVAMLAVWKAGGCYVPLDPEFPRARLELMLSDSEALVVITDSTVLERLPDVTSRSVLVDRDREAIASRSAESLSREGDAHSLAYVIYTSGSTGRPKGVMIPHAAAVNFLTSMQKGPGMTRQDRLLAVTTLSFDIALLELCVPLITGATVVIATTGQRRDPHLLRELLDRSEISLMQATPTMWTQLIASGWQGTPRLRALVGGEALSTKLAGELASRCSEVWNMYGPTETTVWSTRWLVDRPEHGIFIGSPIANTRCLVLDRNQRLAPIGAFGELYIGGAGVARGYLHREDLTRQRFIANPYVPGERLYRTGDRARWRSAGVLEFAGRLDRQIKLRGFRIEIGEIESVLDACDGVDQSVVVVREDRPGDPRLVAYVVGRSLESARLRHELGLKLPQHMVPSSIVVMPQLPLTPNAKVDVNALPSPADTYASPAASDDAMDDIERRLAHEWEEILNYKPVGLDDDFFELGGHSLLALALLLRVQERFGKRLTLASFLEHPTVRAQAKLLRETRVPIEGCSTVPIQGRGSKLPLFFASGWGGPILALHELARRLGTDQPLYLLDYFGHGRAREHEPSIEQIASELVQQMKAIQPRGPYLLVGYSLGAKVVYEMGYQLYCAGESEVALILLDSYAPGHPLLHTMARRLWLHGRKAISQGPIRMIPYLLRRIAGLRRKVIDIEPVLYRRDAGEVLPEMVAEYNHFGKVIYRASKRYQFKKYPASLVLIRAQDTSEWGLSARDDDYTGGWTDWVRHVIPIGGVPSVHTAMLKVEHSARLAELLEQSIDALGLAKESDHPAAAPDLHSHRGAL